MGIPDFQTLDKWEDNVVNPTEARGGYIFIIITLHIHHLLSLQNHENGNMY